MGRRALTVVGGLALVALAVWILLPRDAGGLGSTPPQALDSLGDDANADPAQAAGPSAGQTGAARRRTEAAGSAGEAVKAQVYSVRGRLQQQSVSGRDAPFGDARIEAYAGKSDDQAPRMGRILDTMAKGSKRLRTNLSVEGEPIATAVVQADGHFELKVPGTAPDLRIMLHHRFYGLQNPAVVHRVDEDSLSTGTLETIYGGHVLGRVVGEGLPTGSSVRLIADPDPMSVLRQPKAFMATMMRGASWKATIDDALRFEFRAVVPSPKVAVIAQEDDAVGRCPSFAIAAGETREILLRAVPTTTLVVTTLDAADDATLEGVRIEAVPLEDLGDVTRAYRTQRAKSDDTGACTVRGLDAGAYRIAAQRRGFRPQSIELNVKAPSNAAITLRLDAGARIRGRVVDAEGQAVAKAEVGPITKIDVPMLGDATDMVGADVMAQTARRSAVETEEDGSFELRGLAPDAKLHLAAMHPDYGSSMAKNLQAGDEDVEITLQRLASVTGRVLDGTGAAVTNFEVRSIVKLALVLERPTRVLDCSDCADGRFELRGLQAGSCKLQVAAPQFGLHSQSITVEPSQQLELGDIVLDPAAVVSGRVLDPDGMPLAGALVKRERGGFMDNAIAAAFFGDGSGVQSDAQGRYELAGITPGKMRIIAQHDDFATGRSARISVEAGSAIDGVDLRLTPGGRIEGRLLLPSGRSPEGWEIFATMEPQGAFRTARIDASGAFVIEGLDAGSYMVQGMDMRSVSRSSSKLKALEQSGGTPDVIGMMRDLQDMTVSERVRIDDGETVEVELDASDFDADGTRLECDILIGGKPLATGIVEVTGVGGSQNSLSQVFVSKGRVDVHRLQPGSVRLQLRGGVTLAPIGAAKTVVIPAGKTVVHERWELPGGRISGRVVDDQSGEPVIGGAVKLLRADAAGEPIDFGFGLSGADGSFAFEGLSAGRFVIVSDSLWAGAGSDRVARIDGLTLDADGSIEDLELRVRPGAGVAVTITDPMGRPVTGALVLAVDDAGRPIGSLPIGRSNADGRAWIAGLPDGPTRIVARHSRYAPAASPLRDLSASQPVSFDIQLHGGTEVELEVRDRSGAPLEGSRVAVRQGDLPWIPASLFGSSASGGARIALGQLPPGSCEFRVDHPGGSFTLARSIPRGARATLVLAPPED